MSIEYVARCPTCGGERELSASVVRTGRVPLCDTTGCVTSLEIYRRDPERKPPRRPEDIAREVC